MLVALVAAGMFVFGAPGCEDGCVCSEPRVAVEGIVRHGRTGMPLAGVTVRGPEGAETKTGDGGHFRIRVPKDEPALRASRAGYCPGEGRGRTGEPVVLHLRPRLRVGDDQLEVGFDRKVEVRAHTECDPEATLQWKQLAGPELGPKRFELRKQGRVLEVHTHALRELKELDPRPGVVGLTRRQRGDYRLQVSAELGGKRVTRKVRVVAAATSTGGFQVATGATTYLNGGVLTEEMADSHAWSLLRRPEDSTVELHAADTRTPTLTPDEAGTYLVRHESSGLVMNLQAGAYDEIARDCGRSGCHVAEEKGWEETPHAATFRQGLEGKLGGSFDEACWNCHAGSVDPGVENGGLHRVARGMGFEQPEPHEGLWDEVPRQIRRYGAVWCAACHGAGRILPPQFRWEYGAQYEAGVCARCHDAVDDPDAPHRSPQVRNWRKAAMASFTRGLSDDDPALRDGCARCHSAEGFVHWAGEGKSAVPDRLTATPITCASCHDPHSAEHRANLRVFGEVDAVHGSPASGLGAGAVCASCHRTDPVVGSERDAAAPHAPQSNVLLGRGAKLADGTAGPHAELADSCVDCHMKSPGDSMRGRAGGHTFAVADVGGSSEINERACLSCHEGDSGKLDGKTSRVAEELAQRLAEVRRAFRSALSKRNIRGPCSEPAVAARVVDHDAQLVLATSSGRLLGDCDDSGALEQGERRITLERLPRRLQRAAWDLALLTRDGSKGQHNPPFARAVLDRIAEALKM
jgi:hypothetical protein